MSGIVGGKNHRGSGLIANLGTDGQVLTSAGLGLRQVFEAAAAGANIHIDAGTWDISTTGTIVVTGVGFAPKGGIALAFVHALKKGGSWTFFGDGLTDEVMYDYGGVVEDAYSSNCCMVALVMTDASNYAKLVMTYGADGFTLTKSKVGSPTGTGYWKAFLIG